MAKRRFTRGELSLIFFVLLVMAIIPITLIQSALQEDGHAWVRWSGRRRLLEWGIARFVLGGIGVLMLVAILIKAATLPRAWLDARPDRAAPGDLALGEAVKWRGRPGLRSFGKERAIVLALVVTGTIPLALALVWIWAGTAFPLGVGLVKLGFTGAFLVTLGPMAFAPTWLLLTRDNRWLCELIGEVLVTDRRIVWVFPMGSIAQDVPAEKLVGAELIDRDDSRGWISLRIKKARLVDVDYELRGAPDPETALAAIRRLIRSA